MDRCVKCDGPTSFYRIDASGHYCETCFIAVAKVNLMMVEDWWRYYRYAYGVFKHKFFFAFGRNRIFKRRESKGREEHHKRAAALVYDGSPAAELLLTLVRQGIAAKKLPIKPVVLILLPQPVHGEPSDHEKELEQSVASVAGRMEQFGDGWAWHFVHPAAILCGHDDKSAASGASTIAVKGADKIEEYRQLLAGAKSQSTRAELTRLLTALLNVRIAKEHGCDRILVPDNMERLANVAMVALCYGRGSSIPDLTGTVDSRFDGVQLIRPLRDMSDREIEAISRLEPSNDENPTSTDENRIETNRWSGSSVQKVAHDFLHGLKEDGYPATMTTLLAVSSKLQTSAGGGDTTRPVMRCRLCYAVPTLDGCDSYGCCQPCSDILLELDEGARQTLIQRVLNSSKAG